MFNNHLIEYINILGLWYTSHDYMAEVLYCIVATPWPFVHIYEHLCPCLIYQSVQTYTKVSSILRNKNTSGKSWQVTQRAIVAAKTTRSQRSSADINAAKPRALQSLIMRTCPQRHSRTLTSNRRNVASVDESSLPTPACGATSGPLARSLQTRRTETRGWKSSTSIQSDARRRNSKI